MNQSPNELPDKWPLPRPCARCGWDGGGRLHENRRLDCGQCGAFIKWVPKAELGLAPDQKRTRPDIKPSKRARILAAFNYVCVSCHRDDLPLEIAHLVSVADGYRYGLTDIELFDDLNLVPMCDACNAGQGDLTVGMWLIVKSLRIHIAERDRRT